jgi:hypothetical protein
MITAFAVCATGDGRVGVPRWIRVSAGPVLVSSLVVAGLLGARYLPEEEKAAPGAVGECRVKPDMVQDIRAEEILQRAPRPDRLGEVDDSQLQCGTASLASVSVPLTGSVPRDEVHDFYARLAEKSGWHAFEDSDQVLSAVKPADGGCPWWFLVQPAEYGYQLRVIYLPSGAAADQCAWKSEEPLLMRIPIKLGG